MSKPRLGFLGVGWIGRHRMEMIARAGDAEIAAIYDPSAEMTEAARKIAPKAQICRSAEELFGLGIDGTVIATPSAQHADESIRSLNRGHAVFCQKPLGRNSAEVSGVLRAARRNNRLLGVDLSYRHTEAMQKIRTLLEERAVGDVYAIDLVFHNAYGPDKPWFYDRALSGGGCVMDLGIHLVDLALWSSGFPRVLNVSSRLYSSGKPLSDMNSVEDYAVAQLELETGVTVRLACSWKLPAGCDAVIEASFYGTEGALVFKNVHGSFYDFVAERLSGTRRTTLISPPDAWGGRAAVAWAKQLARDGSFDPEAEQLLRSAEVLDRIYGVTEAMKTSPPRIGPAFRTPSDNLMDRDSFLPLTS